MAAHAAVIFQMELVLRLNKMQHTYQPYKSVTQQPLHTDSSASKSVIAILILSVARQLCSQRAFCHFSDSSQCLRIPDHYLGTHKVDDTLGHRPLVISELCNNKAGQSPRMASAPGWGLSAIFADHTRGKLPPLAVSLQG